MSDPRSVVRRNKNKLGKESLYTYYWCKPRFVFRKISNPGTVPEHRTPFIMVPMPPPRTPTTVAPPSGTDGPTTICYSVRHKVTPQSQDKGEWRTSGSYRGTVVRLVTLRLYTLFFPGGPLTHVHYRDLEGKLIRWSYVAH